MADTLCGWDFADRFFELEIWKRPRWCWLEFRALELQERPCVGELIFVGKSGGACGLATPAPCLAAQVTFAVGAVSTFWLRLLGFGVLPMMVTNEDLFGGTKKRFILPRAFVFLEGERGKTERTRRAGFFFF